MELGNFPNVVAALYRIFYNVLDLEFCKEVEFFTCIVRLCYMRVILPPPFLLRAALRIYMDPCNPLGSYLL